MEENSLDLRERLTKALLDFSSSQAVGALVQVCSCERAPKGSIMAGLQRSLEGVFLSTTDVELRALNASLRGMPMPPPLEGPPRRQQQPLQQSQQGSGGGGGQQSSCQILEVKTVEAPSSSMAGASPGREAAQAPTAQAARMDAGGCKSCSTASLSSLKFLNTTADQSSEKLLAGSALSCVLGRGKSLKEGREGSKGRISIEGREGGVGRESRDGRMGRGLGYMAPALSTSTCNMGLLTKALLRSCSLNPMCRLVPPDQVAAKQPEASPSSSQPAVLRSAHSGSSKQGPARSCGMGRSNSSSRSACCTTAHQGWLGSPKGW